ncbi:MAG: hypothetical protein JXA92_12355 [candidate division Zixibacteria bacterium]|nr:hypothetical protein [candidate division Zixibacteria bacterium]
MSPELLPETARTFLIVNTALLVFSIGIPSLVIQLTVPEKLRLYILKNLISTFGLFLAIPLILVANSMMLIFYLYPYPYPVIIPLKVWYGEWAGCFLAICIILSIIGWVWYLKQSIMDKLITKLRIEMEKRFKKSGMLDVDLLEDFIEIGVYGEPNNQKALVIREFGELIKYVQRGYQKNKKIKKYEGQELVILLRKYDKILINNSSPGDDNNFLYSFGILANIFENLKNENRLDSIDHQFTIVLMKRLGKKAIEICSRSTCLCSIDLSKNRADILFSLGVIALKYNRFEVLKTIQNKLESLAERAGLKQNEETAFLLGILSHIRKSESQSMRELANSYLETNKNLFKPSVTSCLHYAREFYDRFDTKDNIKQLIKKISNKISISLVI